MTENSAIRLGVVRGIQYGLMAGPDAFAPMTRELGVGGVRVFFYWSQLEPERGRYDWAAVDAALGQMDAGSEVWFTVTASSPWGSTRATDWLPASTPHEPEVFAAMVRALVAHCAGRVRFWQCENEPSNALFWADSAPEYARHLRVFHDAVKSADPRAEVVLGGCSPGVFADLDAPEPEREFMLHVMGSAADSYDVFDIHLYGDPYLVPTMIENARAAMRAAGDEKPVVAGEYNGPLLVQYPELFAELGDVFAADPMKPWHTVSVADVESGRAITPGVRAAMERLYARMPELPLTLQMFMVGCPPEAEATWHHRNADDLVIRNILALESGLDRTFCWQLSPETPQPQDPYSFLALLFQKFALFGYDEAQRPVKHPAAKAFAELAFRLDGAKSVRRIPVPGRPDAYLFDLVGTEWQVAWLRPQDPAVEPEPLICGNIKVGASPIYLRAGD